MSCPAVLAALPALSFLSTQSASTPRALSNEDSAATGKAPAAASPPVLQSTYPKDLGTAQVSPAWAEKKFVVLPLWAGEEHDK